METNEKVLVTANAVMALNIQQFNGLTYPEEIFTNAFSEDIKNGVGDYIYGSIRELYNRDFSIQENGFRITKVQVCFEKKPKFCPSSIVMKLEIFDTPAGKFAEKFCKHDVFYGEVVPVCRCSFDKNGVVDANDFKLEGFDLVIDLDKLYTTDEKFYMLEKIRHDIYTSVANAVPFIHKFVDFTEDKISFRDDNIGDTIINVPGISTRIYENFDDPHNLTQGSFVINRDFSNIRDSIQYFIGYYKGLYRLSCELERLEPRKSE